MPKKQKNKYRYFYCSATEQFVRFRGKDGSWWDKQNGKFLCFVSHFSLEYFINDPESEEVTLSQGLHYMKGNYVE